MKVKAIMSCEQLGFMRRRIDSANVPRMNLTANELAHRAVRGWHLQIAKSTNRKVF